MSYATEHVDQFEDDEEIETMDKSQPVAGHVIGEVPEGRWVNDPIESPTEAQKLFWNDCSQRERKIIIDMANLGIALRTAHQPQAADIDDLLLQEIYSLRERLKIAVSYIKERDPDFDSVLFLHQSGSADFDQLMEDLSPQAPTVEVPRMDRSQFNPFPMFIRLTRAHIGMTIREMADDIGITPTRLSELETDHGSRPTEEEIRTYASKLALLTKGAHS